MIKLSRLLVATALPLAVLPLVTCGRSGPPQVMPTPSAISASPTAHLTPTVRPTPTVKPTLTVEPTLTGKPTSAPPPTTTSSTKPPLTTAPAPFPRSLLGMDVDRIPTTSKIVALTFDAGANADGVTSILATLDRERVKATFFLTARFTASFPEQSRRIVAAGHRLGNHSVDHPHFTDLTDAQIRAQLVNAASAIRTTTGASPAPLFRFPFGDRDARTIATVNAAGYVAVRWTVDSLGWQGTVNGTRNATFVTQRVLGAATAGEIVLMHVGSHPDDRSTLDADALPAIIAGLRARGYVFVTLDALVG